MNTSVIIREIAKRKSQRQRENKNAKRLNFIKGALGHSPSQPNGSAKIQINSETAKQNLKKVAEKYKEATEIWGFLTDLEQALGIHNGTGASKYGVIAIPRDNGNEFLTLRISNHNANVNTYTQHEHYDYNLSIVVRKMGRRNTFIPNDNVILDEYVYYGNKIKDVESPLSQIALSLIGYIESGVYIDTTGRAIHNESPQHNENKQYNIMKKRIKLTESDLRRIVNNSVKKVLKESRNDEFDRIRMAASEIMESTRYTQEEDYEPWDDCDGPDLTYDLYKWAEKVINEAEMWQHKYGPVPLNAGLEDW